MRHNGPRVTDNCVAILTVVKDVSAKCEALHTSHDVQQLPDRVSILPDPVSDHVFDPGGEGNRALKILHDREQLLKDQIACERKELAYQDTQIDSNLQQQATRCGVNWTPLNEPYPHCMGKRFLFDEPKMKSLSLLAHRSKLSLTQFIRLFRGQTPSDNRPNKALRPDLYSLLQGYPYRNAVVAIATEGMRPPWTKFPPYQSGYVRNHRSGTDNENVVCKSLRTGQDTNRILALHKPLPASWYVQTCPYGAVDKKDKDPLDEMRLIHDFKYPPGASVNECLRKFDIPAVKFFPMQYLAQRILYLRDKFPGYRIKMMLADVDSAFRNLPMHEEFCWLQAGTLPSRHAICIDLAATFGCRSSPGFYSLFGRAVSFLLSKTKSSVADILRDTNLVDVLREPYFIFEWVDDHILIEVDAPYRLCEAELSLRESMVNIFGPHAVKESKFQPWSSVQRALGLEWDIDAGIVTMPHAKVLKAISRLENFLTLDSAPIRTYNQLLGSLRHVASCFRSTKSFLQSLQHGANYARVHSAAAVTAQMRTDSTWLLNLLRSDAMHGVPFEFFRAIPSEAHYNVYMDSSDYGYAAINLSTREYLRGSWHQEDVQHFSRDSRTSINVRELLNILFALLAWGPTWSSGTRETHHICVWIDNTSAVAWNNRLASPNPLAQHILQHIALLEILFNVYITAAHIPGDANWAADAASRDVTQQVELLPHFTNLTHHCLQVPTPPLCAQPFTLWGDVYKNSLWPILRAYNTTRSGTNGSPGVVPSSTPHLLPTILSNSTSLHSMLGTSASTQLKQETPIKPSDRSLAQSLGIIGPVGIQHQHLQPSKLLPSKACKNSQVQYDIVSPYCPAYYAPSTNNSIFINPPTNYFGGEFSWVSSSYYGDQTCVEKEANNTDTNCNPAMLYAKIMKGRCGKRQGYQTVSQLGLEEKRITKDPDLNSGLCASQETVLYAPYWEHYGQGKGEKHSC